MKSILASFKLTAISLSILAFFTPSLQAQINLNFDSEADQNFEKLGISGDTSDFLLRDQRLYLDANQGSSPSTIFLPSTSIYNATWEFTIGMEFNPSSSNYIQIQLAGDENGENRYYFRLGGSEDDLRLYRVVDGDKTVLIDGDDDRVDLSNIKMTVKIQHDSTGLWTLSSKLDSEVEFRTEGFYTDNSLTASTHFTISCFFTSTRADKFWLDDIIVEGDIYPDIRAPILDSIVVNNTDELQLFFDEPIILDSSKVFEIAITAPQINELDSFWLIDSKKLTLNFKDEFINGHTHDIILSGIADEVDNEFDSILSFLYYLPSQVNFRDIVFNEVMVDPNPREDLPATEFIEIWNISDHPISMQNWILQDNRSETSLTNYILLPGNFLILTSSENADLYTDFGPTMGLDSWPTLNNDQDHLLLLNEKGKIIDEFEYDIPVRNDEKKSGGWSLELINPHNPCKLVTNWMYSQNVSGGSPGSLNSIYTNEPDSIAPIVLKISHQSDSTVVILFSESILTNEEIEIRIDGQTIQAFELSQNLPNELYVNLDFRLETNITYHFELSGFTDCFSNFLNVTEFDLSFDLDPPQVDSIFSIHPNQIEIIFNEPIEAVELSANVTFLDTTPSVIFNPEFPKQISILLDTFLIEPFEMEIQLNNLKDISGNSNPNYIVAFNYQPPAIAQPLEILVTEFMADPVPSAGLPEVEFIEIINTTNEAFSLRGMMVSDKVTTGRIMDGIIDPDERVILTRSSKVGEFENFGKTIGVSPWPNLNSSGDSIILKNIREEIIFLIVYEQSWYGDDEKKDGGWSLELVAETCLGKFAWSESAGSQGGTPGAENSVTQISLPELNLTHLSVLTPDSILLEFNRPFLQESLDLSSVLVNDSLYSQCKIVPGPTNAHAVLVFFSNFTQDSLKIRILGIEDCVGTEAIIEFNHFFDETPPTILAHSIIFKNRIDLLFSEEITSSMIHPMLHDYENVELEIITPTPDRLDSIAIIFNKLEIEQSYTLELKSVTDLASNINDISFHFDYKIPKVAGLHELIITEVMVSPLHDSALNSEYIEIHNTMSERISLNGYSISDDNTMALIDYYIIGPNSYAILVPENSPINLVDITIIKVSPWPQLNNSGDIVTLTNSIGQKIHEINYSDSWYNSEWKKDGGWAIEMIDIQNPCGEEGNWTASEDEMGGTPGQINSVNAVKPDLKGPEILSVLAIGRDTIRVQFNEKIEPSSIVQDNFNINEGIEIGDVLLSENHREVWLLLNDLLEPGLAYELNIGSVTDCNGNIFTDSKINHPVVLAANPSEGDIVINEILFNPIAGGSDFIELFNKSDKYLQLKSCIILGEKDTVTIPDNLLIGPREYLAITRDKTHLLSYFAEAIPETIHEYPLPSWPDDEGKATLLSKEKIILDEIKYNEDMHMDLFFEVEGLSLERVDVDQPSGNESNWKTASSVINGTPGYKNSQSHTISFSTKPITLTPNAFDPRAPIDNFLTISFNFDEPGYFGNLEIYNLEGRKITQLMTTEYLPQSGFTTWLGTDDAGNIVPIGSYIIYFEIFNLEGKVSRFKKFVVVSTRF